MQNDFKSLGLSSEVLSSIDKLGYKEPSEIQSKIIPLIINGDDLIGQAQTGTGKTLAFAASILSKINVEENYVQSMILTPTRELALQVCAEFKKLNNSKEFKIVAVYGGDSVVKQIKDLKGADIVVGTPGRTLDLIERKRLKIDQIKTFVLDEADEMLNMGFLEDIEEVLKKTAEDKQTLMFSATMHKNVKKLAENFMKDTVKHIEVISETKTSDNIEELYTIVNEKHRLEILMRMLDFHNESKTIIFCHTKKECDNLLMDLKSKKYSAVLMHGDISQNMRIDTLEKFKRGSHRILIATDIAARGIHIDNIDLVINYKIPKESEIYVHRIGRTGRANNKGMSITFVSHKDLKKLKDIAKITKSSISEYKIPTADDITRNKYIEVLKQAEKVSNPEDAYEYLRDMNKNDLLHIAAKLLKHNIDKSIGSNINKEIVINDKRSTPRDIDKNKTRVFVNIGRKDNLKKGSLLDFIKDKTKMKKDYFHNIEVLNTFTFIDVDTKFVDEFMKKITGKTFSDRKIRVEISNKSKKRRK